MECPICMNLLSETPDPTSPSLPPAKKQKKEGNNATSNTSVTISTPCGHIFHRICLQGWLKGTSGVCPTCRRKITMKSTHPLFLDFQKVGPDETSSISKTNPKKGEETGSKQAPCHTDMSYSELQQNYHLLWKEHEILQEKHRQEKERADLNEAIVMSLRDENSDKTHTSNNNSQSQTKTDSKDRNGNSIESQSDEGGGVDVNVLNWFSSGFDYWFNDSGSNDNDESNWWE